MLKKSNSSHHGVKLSLLTALLLIGLPAYAVDYTFPSNLPAGCAITQAATATDRYTYYTCVALPLAVGDNLIVSSPSKVTLTGALVAGADVKINENGSADDFYLESVGAIGLGANTILNANVTSHAAINMGANSSGSGSMKTYIGAITLGANVRFAGDLTTGTGGIEAGAGSVLGKIKTIDVGAINIGATATVESMEANTGAATIGAGATIIGHIRLGPGAGAMTIGANTHIGGDVSAAVGAITLGANSDMCGEVSTGPGVGAITLGADVHVGGNIKTATGAISIGAQSQVGGSITTSDAKTMGAGAVENSTNVTRCPGNKINICENNVDKMVKKTDFKNKSEGTHYYIGKCNALACTNSPTNTQPANCTAPLPDAPEQLGNQVVKEFEPVTGSVYCDDGGVKSDSAVFAATIKRATIANATTVNGTFETNALVNAKPKYGNKTSGIGTMDISDATVTGGKATGVTLTNVTLKNVYIDTDIDFISSTGSVNPDGTDIKVMGGTTSGGTITSGMITAGKDASENPMRGSIVSGRYSGSIDNAATVIIKGRRIRGDIEGATITNATTTTVSGETRVNAGTITSGTLATGSTSKPISTFGTVINTTLTGISLTNSNHCFTSGTVGSKGTLNWKEVIQ